MSEQESMILLSVSVFFCAMEILSRIKMTETKQRFIGVLSLTLLLVALFLISRYE